MILKIFLLILITISSYSQVILSKEELDYIKNKKVIKVSNEYDYEPYDFSKNGKERGYSIDLLNLLLKNTDLKIEYVTKPWDELLKDLNDKKIDLLHTIYKTPQREKIYNYSVGYSKTIQSYIIRQNDNDIKDIKQLFGKTIGLSKEWVEEKIFNKYPKIKKIYYTNLQDKLNALSKGEIDAIINSANVANYYINKYGYSNLKVSTPFKEEQSIQLDDHHFVTLKDNPYLISILNKEYDNLSIEEIEKLNKKWFGNLSPYNGKIKIHLTSKEKEYLRDKQTIKICIDPQWMPFESFDQDGNYIGIIADHYKVFEELLSVKFQALKTNSWTETLEYAKQKKCDIVSVLMETNERKEYLNFTAPYLTMPLVIATKLNVTFINNINELAGKKVGIPKGYSFVKIFKEKYPFLNIIEVENIDDGLKKLKKGELFAYFGTLPSIIYKLQNKYGGDLKISGKIDEQWSLRIGIRNDDIELLNILQKVVENMSEQYKREIINKWVSIKYEKGINYELLWSIVAVFILILVIVLYFFNKQRKFNIQLKEQKEEFESIFKYSKDGIAILNLEFQILDCNDAYLAIIGYEKEELLTKNYLDFFDSNIKNEIDKLIKEVYSKGFVDNFSTIYISKNGKKIYTNITITMMPDKQRYLLTSKDITSTKLLESQSKLALMGEMIGNIAHQWRQPLSVITTSASALKIRFEFDEKMNLETVSDFSNKIIEQAEYLSHTIDDFKNFIKGDKEYRKISIKNIIKSTISLTSATIKNNFINLVTSLPDDIIIYGNKNELEQAFINIINNAKDQLKEKNIPDDHKFIFIYTKQHDDGSLEVSISDSGGGIPLDIIDRVFEPYFTTKDNSIGTGIGLSMVHKIITERHQAQISVTNLESKYNEHTYKGACFSIIFSKPADEENIKNDK